MDLSSVERAEPRRWVACIAAATIFCTPAFAQSATPSEISEMVEIARDTCLSTFPSYRNIAPRLAAAGLAQDEQGTWRGDSAIVLVRKASNGTLDCEVWMSKNSKAKDVSDRLQANLSNMGVPILSASRKGVRLSADFSKEGAAGSIRVEPMSGRTSKIVVSHEVGS